MMNEDFLHYIWKFQLFNHRDLQTTDGEKVEVIKSGLHNHDSGPDFFNGQVRIGETLWAGNIEIHLKSSDWFQHAHQKNRLYDKIILHLVWENDQVVKRENGDAIPTIELKGRVSRLLLDKHRELNNSKGWIPCEKEIDTVEEIKKELLIDQMLVERLEIKASRIQQLFGLNKQDWEGTLYQLIAKYFGFKVNAVPFELLTSSLPLSLVRKYRENELQLTALFFGQAGFLNETLKDDYPKALQKEYQFLRRKHQLKPLQKELWKFMRMRPSNFPTIRIAQFVQLQLNHSNLFQKTREAKDIRELRALFLLQPNSYWEKHYRFDVLSSRFSNKQLGKNSIDIILINAVIPLLFSYADAIGEQKKKDRVFDLLQAIPPEKNKITRKWADLKMNLDSAYTSQALIQLKQHHCELKKCLTCTIGNQLLKVK